MNLEDVTGLPTWPCTPLEAIPGVVRETVLVEGQSFRIDRPDQSDRLLNHPAIRATFAADEYLPYWAELWPAARMLAKAVLREPWTAGMEALEIGCGLGLPGIAGLARGLEVTFSDYDTSALRFAAGNARLNGFDDFDVLPLDWRQPPAGLHFPVLLASEPIYDFALVDSFADKNFVLFGLTNEAGGNARSDATISGAMNHAVGTIRAEEDKLGVPHHIVTVQGNNYSANLKMYTASPSPSPSPTASGLSLKISGKGTTAKPIHAI